MTPDEERQLIQRVARIDRRLDQLHGLVMTGIHLVVGYCAYLVIVRLDTPTWLAIVCGIGAAIASLAFSVCADAWAEKFRSWMSNLDTTPRRDTSFNS